MVHFSFLKFKHSLIKIFDKSCTSTYTPEQFWAIAAHFYMKKKNSF